MWLASEVGDVDIVINNARISAFGPTAEFDPAVFASSDALVAPQAAPPTSPTPPAMLLRQTVLP